MRYNPVIFCALFAAICFSCGKLPEVKEETPDIQVPLTFQVTSSEMETKAQTNKAMGSAYDTNESFVVFAAYSENHFNPSNPSSYSNFWNTPGGLTCFYDSQHNAWAPSTTYYWPRAGYLTFQAYSPFDAGDNMTGLEHSWSNGFTFNGFTVPDAYSQYDLLYSARVDDCQRSNYTVTRPDGYDDDPNYPTFIYNGINLAFKHALSLIEVQTVSALGSNASLKFYVQKIKLKNAYNKGTFTQNGETWSSPSGKVDYAVLDKGTDWQLVPGADETPVSVNRGLTLMLMPQTLHRSAGSTLVTSTDAYLEVTYKEGSSGTTETIQIPLTDPWLIGKKHIYKLIFSNHIEFTAQITDWEDEIRGYHRIVI